MASASGIKLGHAYVLIDAVDRTKQACNAALKNIATLADNVMAIGTNLTIGATIAVTLDASASRAFREFEETMLKVKAKSKDTAGATVAAYDKLIEKARELGRATKFNAPQVADAMAGMAAAGLSRGTIDKAIKNVLDLALATGVEIPTASRIAMAAMQQFNMTAEQSAEICDVLSAAVNNSALTLEDIGESFKYAAPLAREFGMDIKQLATVIAALGNAGIKGSQAGTSLRLMMVKLAKPGGYDLEKFNKDFEANVQRDIEVNDGGVIKKRTRPIIEILRDMGKAMDEYEKKHPDVDPQKKLQVFADLFGRISMTSAATLADNMKNLDTLMKAINNSSGTAGKTAEIMNSGIVRAHYAFVSAWKDVAIEYGKAINETVMTFYDGFTKIAHVIQRFIKNNQNIINIVTGITAATGALGISMITGAGAVKTFAVVGGMFTSTVGAMASAAYGFAIALNSWINPLITVEGLLRGLTAVMSGVAIPVRGLGGVMATFAPRWNLPWQAVPAGASRLTVAQSAKAGRLLNAYYARSLAEGEPAGVLHRNIARREKARLSAMRYYLSHKGMLETLNSRVDPRNIPIYEQYHKAAIRATQARDEFERVKSKQNLREETIRQRKAARIDYNSERKRHSVYARAQRNDYAALVSCEDEKLRNARRSIQSTYATQQATAIAAARAHRDKRIQTLSAAFSNDKKMQQALIEVAKKDYEKQVANAKASASSAREAAIASAIAQRKVAVQRKKSEVQKNISDSLRQVDDKKSAIKNAPIEAQKKVGENVRKAARELSDARKQRDYATRVMRAANGNRYVATRGMRVVRPDDYLRGSLTRDFGRNNQYLRERMRMLRIAGFYDTTPDQRILRSAEIIKTRNLMTANNMMLGRQRWGAFFRPFTDALQRATRAVGQFGMQTWGAIRRIGIHPIAGARSLIANAGSMLFAGLAPGGGIMKGIGATFKFAFTYLKRGLVPVMQTLLRLAVQFATAPLTWAAGLTYATLQGGKLKEVMAGVYIAISAIGVGVSKLWEQLKNLFSWLGKSIKENMAQSNAIIDPVIDMWKGTFSRLFDDMKGSFSVITEAIGAGRWGDAFKVLGAQWRVIRAELSATLRNNWEHMKYTFMTVWNRVVDYFQNGEGLWGIFKWLIGNLWNVTKWVVGELYNAITTFWTGRVQIGDATINKNTWFDNTAFNSMKTIFDEYRKRGIKFDSKLYPVFDGAITAETLGRVPELNGIKEELQRLVAQARVDINGENVIVPSAENKGGLGYTADEIEKQRKRAMDDTGAIKSVADDKEVIEARRYLDETKSGVRGNVERQEAAKAAQQLKEREEGVVKELGEEGVGRIGEILEGFYDFSDTDDNRKKGLILAAGEYITEMGISIDKFAEIIETLKKIPGFGLANTGMYSSEKSNVEYYANMADEVVRAGMTTLATEPFKDGIKFNLTNSKGESIEKVLGAERDGTKLTTFERLKELGEVLATLSTEQKQSVRAQFVDQYGETATSAIENALDTMYQRNAKVDFTEEENYYRHNENGATAYERLSQYERDRIDTSISKFAEKAGLSEKNLDLLKEGIANQDFLPAKWKDKMSNPGAIIKTSEYERAFGGKSTRTGVFVPEEQNKNLRVDTTFAKLTSIFGGLEEVKKNQDKYTQFMLQAGSLATSSSLFNLEEAGRYILDINNSFKSKELDKKARYYGGDVENMSNMDKLRLLKEREGTDAVRRLLQNGMGVKRAKDFADWLNVDKKKEEPQVWTVVQAHIQGMLDTFRAFTENRSRVILDRRAKAEKDAKAKEEEEKKKKDEERLKDIHDKLDDIAGCVNKGSKSLNVDMGVA